MFVDYKKNELRVFDCCVRGNNFKIVVFEFLIILHDKIEQSEGSAGKSLNQVELVIFAIVTSTFNTETMTK